MDKAKEYINSKTNSILKTNILRNNRDVVATIVYNELTDLLEFSNTSSVTTPIDSEILKRYLHQVKPQLYSGIPMKLKPYCIKCGCGNGYFRGLYDPYVLALLTEDADPWLWEDNGVVLLEQQKENNLIDNDVKNEIIPILFSKKTTSIFEILNVDFFNPSTHISYSLSIFFEKMKFLPKRTSPT